MAKAKVTIERDARDECVYHIYTECGDSTICLATIQRGDAEDAGFFAVIDACEAAGGTVKATLSIKLRGKK